ncbi:GIY-YIG nuclease family protein [Enterococcus alishanensis]
MTKSLILKEKVSLLPESPGVYFMKDNEGQTIYVGKAKNLKRRVASYFRNNKQHSKKVIRMVGQIDDFDFQLVDTEFDALILECQKIHQIRPHFNQRMNRYENYGFFQFLDEEPYLKVLNHWSNQGQIIGPFFKQAKMIEIKKILMSLYRLTGPLRFAKDIVNISSELTPEEEFTGRLTEISDAFKGRPEKVLQRIEDKIQRANHRQDFETAAIWWQNYLIIERFLRRNKQLILTLQGRFFIGLLAENNQYYCYLYSKGMILNRIVYKRRPTFEQMQKKLLHSIPKENRKNWLSKEHLDKEDADLFPIFFNYLNAHGTAQAIFVEEQPF